MAGLYLQTDLLKKYLKDEKSQFNQLILKGLTHPKTIIKIIFKNFYLFLTHNIQSYDLKKSFLVVLINSIHISDAN